MNLKVRQDEIKFNFLKTFQGTKHILIVLS